MTEKSSKAGTIGGFDLTVPNAESIRDFYAAVVGWTSEPFATGGYDDYFMIPAEGATPVAGICHARGESAALPPYWLAYVVVDNLAASLKRCAEQGGAVICSPFGEPSCGPYGVIQDPAGAYLTLMETESEPVPTETNESV